MAGVATFAAAVATFSAACEPDIAVVVAAAAVAYAVVGIAASADVPCEIPRAPSDCLQLRWLTSTRDHPGF